MSRHVLAGASGSQTLLDDRTAIISVAFPAVLELSVFLAVLWTAGQLANRLKWTPLVGEVVVGAALGPPLAAYPAYPPSLQLLGELGLLLSIVESGLRVELKSVRLVGMRGLAVSFISSFLPLPVAVLVSWGLFHCSLREAGALAICFIPSSTNVAVLVLSRASLINTPTGQTVLAAGFFSDVYTLVALSELRALQSPSVQRFLEPLLGLAFTVLLGYASVVVVPYLLLRLLPLLPTRMIDKACLCALAGTTAGLMAALEELSSSYLLGAFPNAPHLYSPGHTTNHPLTNH